MQQKYTALKKKIAEKLVSIMTSTRRYQIIFASGHLVYLCDAQLQKWV
jgi:hypothetical protein